jgi:asparagine synthase (glutamine-hydrolysing)
MCGLVVFCDTRRVAANEADAQILMQKALKAIGHRGIRYKTTSGSNFSLFGHVRLPIQGLGVEFDQPVRHNTTTNQFVGVYVGEIFNKDTWMPNVPSDVPLMMQILRDEKRDRRLKELDGFWSTVHINTKGNIEARTDHLGIKPLYIHKKLGIIASEIRAIEAVAGGQLTVDEIFKSNVAKWGYDPTGRTPFKEVSRLEPGTSVVWNMRTFKKDKYWSIRAVEHKATIQKLVTQAIKLRMIGDLPIAVLCSGGLDSTIVAKVAESTNKPLTVFHVLNVSPGDTENFNKITWAKNVTVVTVELDDSLIQEAMIATEEPVDLGSVLPQYLLGKVLKKHGFNVVLTGDGADELFGGYRRAMEYDSQASDIFCELVHYHLPRLDKTMMWSTVELRSPFLAPVVIEKALSLPYKDRRNKDILREAFKDVVPEHILNRKKEPLKTEAVRTGGQEYRNALIEDFYAKYQN